MLQVFRLDVAQVDPDVAYVAIPIHACFKCFVCFRRMLQMFHLDVSRVDLVLHGASGWRTAAAAPAPVAATRALP
jgi:hypothetical protein